MKKSMVYALLFVLMGAAIFVSGCSTSEKSSVSSAATSTTAQKTQKPEDTQKTTEISWWVPNWDEQNAKDLISQFESENPNIKVKMVITTWDTMANKIQVALTGNNAPEVISELESRVKVYAENNLLTKLDSYYAKDLDKKDFISSALAINTYKDSVYGVSFRHDGSGVLYNKAMFKDAGLDPNSFPKTWDEFVSAAKKLTKDTNGDGKIDQYAMAWQLGNENNAVTRFAQLLYTNGGKFFDESGKKALLDTPEAINAMKMLTSTVADGYAPKSTMELDNTKLRDLFINKKIAMYFSGPFDIDPIKKNSDIDLGTAVMPGINGMGTTTVDGFSLIMPNSAKNKEAGWKLMNFIAQPKNMAKLTATFPGRKSALSEPKFSDPLLKPFADQLENGDSIPVNVHWAEVSKTLYRYIQSIILEKQDIKETMTKANKEIDGILQK